MKAIGLRTGDECEHSGQVLSANVDIDFTEQDDPEKIRHSRWNFVSVMYPTWNLSRPTSRWAAIFKYRNELNSRFYNHLRWMHQSAAKLEISKRVSVVGSSFTPPPPSFRHTLRKTRCSCTKIGYSSSATELVQRPQTCSRLSYTRIETNNSPYAQ